MALNAAVELQNAKKTSGFLRMTFVRQNLLNDK